MFSNDLFKFIGPNYNVRTFTPLVAKDTSHIYIENIIYRKHYQ